MRRLGVLVVMVLAAGCGPRPPGAVANQTYFWRVVSSEVTFGTCSDEKQFRTDLMPLKFEANSFLIYKVEPDGKTAVAQTCERVDPSTCKPSTTNVVFTVANPELLFSNQGKSAFGTNCELLDNINWTLVDKSATGTLEITHVLSLVGAPAACMASENQFKLQSPNMLGLEGCVVTFKIGLTLN